MTRPYNLNKRAKQQAETRRRIVEAAVELHTELGPARTPASLVAERAGVQRKTYYAHFPNERSLALACSGLHAERDPLPDPAEWSAMEGGGERLIAGLTGLYEWFARNVQLTAVVLRDAEYHPLTRDIAELRYGGPIKAIATELGKGMTGAQQRLLQLAMSFPTWRTLAVEGGMDNVAAARLMAGAIESAR